MLEKHRKRVVAEQAQSGSARYYRGGSHIPGADRDAAAIELKQIDRQIIAAQIRLQVTRQSYRTTRS